MMNKILFTIALLLCQQLFSQKKEPIYYNDDWKVTTKENASFYRPMPLKEIGELVLLHDFYINGTRQFEAYTLKNDENAYVGDVIWYDENGNDDTFRQFTNNTKNSELTYYHANGNIRKKIHYKNGVKEGETTIYDYSGKELIKGIYKNGDPENGNFEVITKTYELDTKSTPPPPVSFEATTMIEPMMGSEAPRKEEIKTPKKTITEQIYWANTRKLAQEKIYSLDSGSLKLFQQKNYDQSGKLIQTINDNDLTKYNKKIINGTLYEYFLQNNFATGIKSETNMQQERKNGKAISYYPNGKVFLETNYKDGAIEGEELRFDETGKISSKRVYKENHPFNGNFDENVGALKVNVNYINGQKEGEAIAKNDRNEIVAKGIYKQGKPFNGTFATEDDDKYEIIAVENYKKSGMQKQYHYRFDDLVKTYHVKDDKLNGITTFYNDGDAVAAVEYKNDEPYNGTLIDAEQTTIYKNGKIISETTYQNGYLRDENSIATRKIYENGVLAKIVDHTYTISAHPQKSYEGIFKNGKPYSGYFQTEEEKEFKQIDYYENGTKKFQFSNNYLKNMEKYQHPTYDIKSTYKNGKIYDGVEYSFDNGQFISRHLKNGVLQSFDWDIFAMHYFNRIHFELKNNIIEIADLRKEVKAEIKIDKTGKQLLVNGKIVDSRTFQLTESTGNKFARKVILYYKENNKIVPKITEIKEYSYEDMEDLELIYNVYYGIKDGSKPIRGIFENLSENIGSPQWLNETEETNIITGIRIDSSGKPEDGVLITPLANNFYQLESFAKGVARKKADKVAYKDLDTEIKKLNIID